MRHGEDGDEADGGDGGDADCREGTWGEGSRRTVYLLQVRWAGWLHYPRSHSNSKMLIHPAYMSTHISTC